MTTGGYVADIDALEVRLATVMTGGVSLAVWMGGVTAELYRAQAGVGIYGRLAEELQLRVRIDVISGTSAGGLNGVLLAAALVRELPVDEMQSVAQVWLEHGDLARLLRSPFAADPPSLLRGDEHFLPVIKGVLERWEDTAPAVERSPFDPEVQLLVTATTLTGEPEFFEDDFGSRLDQTTHMSLFRFRHADLVADGASARLALAARSSASFPGGFEASFCPVGSTGPHDQADMDGVASFRSSRWAVDGGVLRNLPIGPAIEAIFEQPASAAVRRVLVYVNPDPGEVHVPGADDPADTPTLVKVIASSTTSLPRHEAVGEHLAQIRAHNAQVQRQRFARRNVLEICEPATAAETLFPQFRTLRIEHSVRSTSARLRERASLLHLTHTASEGTWQALEAALEVAARHDWLPDALPDPTDLGPAGPPWPWGISPIDYAVSTVVELIGNTLAAIPISHDTEGARADLIEGKRLLSQIVARLASVRELDDAYWNIVVRLAAQRTVLSPTTWATACYEQWPIVSDDDLDEVAAHDRSGALAAADYRRTRGIVTAAILGADHELDQVAVRTLLGGVARSVTLAAAWIAPRVRTYQADDVIARHLLAGQVPVDDDGLARWTHRWLSLYVIQIAVGGLEQPREQAVRLLQVSANRAHSLDPRRRTDAAVKLNGVEGSHFGAFLKRSWRANDWMWGRLDGSSRLVLALLDPARIAQVCSSPAEAADLVARVATGSATGLSTGERDTIEAEMAFLGGTGPLPQSLPRSAELLGDRIGSEVLREELPKVAEAVVASERDGAGMNGSAASFVTAVDRALAHAAGPEHLSDDVVRTLLGTCVVGEESIADELGSDAGTRVATTALAVGAGALQGQQSGLGSLRNPFRVVRTAMVAVAVVARAATQTGAVGSLLIGAGLAAAGLVIGADLGGVNVPGALTAACVALAVVWTLITIAAAGSWAAIVPALIIGGVTLSLGAEDLGDGLDRPPSGWRATLIENPEAATRVAAGIALIGALLVGLSLGRTVATRGWWRPSNPGRIAVCILLVGAAVWLRRQDAATICTAFSDGSTCPGAAVPSGKEDLLDGLARLRDLLPVTLAVALPAGLLGADLLRRGSRRARLAWWELRTATVPPTSPSVRWRPVVLGTAIVVLLHNALVALDLPDGTLGIAHVIPLLALLLWARDRRESWLGPREAVPNATKVGTQAATMLLLPVAALWAAGWIPSDPRYQALDGWHLALHCLTIVVFVAIVEETLFRGVLLGLGSPDGRAFRGIVFSSVAFGLWHVAAEMSRVDQSGATTAGRWLGVGAGLAVTTGSGFLLAWLRLRGRHVLAPTIAHAAFNIGVFLASATVS